MRTKAMKTAALLLLVGAAATGCGDDQTGTGGVVMVTPGLWVGEMADPERPNDRWEICLYVNEAGTALTRAESCNLNDTESFAAQLVVQNAGVSSGDERCSFEFQMTEDIPLDPNGSFTSGMESGPATIALAGFLGVDSGSGTASANGLPNIERCTLMEWTANPVVQ